MMVLGASKLCQNGLGSSLCIAIFLEYVVIGWIRRLVSVLVKHFLEMMSKTFKG